MIGRRKHPREGASPVFVPLRRAEGNRWVPVLDRGFRETLWEAAQICAHDHAARMAEIAQRARVVRAISEHPELEFFFESVDADMLRDEIRTLEEMIRVANENAAHLLAPPDRECVIYEGGVRMRGSEGGFIELWPRRDNAADVLDGTFGVPAVALRGELPESPDELFGHLLEGILHAVEQLTGETVGPAGIADAIARLRDVHSGGDDGDGHDGETDVDDTDGDDGGEGIS